MFEDLKEGLNDAINDAKSNNKFLKRNTISFIKPINYRPSEIKKVRLKIGFSQNLFANFLGVSKKTVEAWEAGTNKPSGPSNRLITILNDDEIKINKLPFVKSL